MKGDNNPTPDVQKPKLEDISGVVFFVIPYVGKLMTMKMLIMPRCAYCVQMRTTSFESLADADVLDESSFMFSLM
mgnify:CR=1 FL=1